MKNTTQILNIVDEKGKILGTATREEVHDKGLLHREVNVWFYTPGGKIIFQHRAPDKDTNPDLLDATAGGHVDLGMDFEGTALKEIQEETGLQVASKDLQFIAQIHSTQHDARTGCINNALQNVYAYSYSGRLSQLRVEPGKAVAFEAWPIKGLFNLSSQMTKRFIFPLIPQWYPQMFRQIEALVNQESPA